MAKAKGTITPDPKPKATIKSARKLPLICGPQPHRPEYLVSN